MHKIHKKLKYIDKVKEAEEEVDLKNTKSFEVGRKVEVSIQKNYE